MRRVLILTAVLCQSVFGYASYSGWCENGGVKVTVQGLSSPLTFQQSFPNLLQSATGPNVTVYATGTTNKVTLYSDAAGTPLDNPFPCSSSGQYQFFSTSEVVDVLFSGTGISSFTRSGIPIQEAVNYVSDQNGLSLSSNCSQAASRGATLMISKATIVSTLTCGANVYFYTGGKITYTGQITFNGSVDGDLSAHFIASGSPPTPVFTGSVKAFYPQWFGDSTTCTGPLHDSVVAVQAAVDAAAGRTVIIPGAPSSCAISAAGPGGAGGVTIYPANSGMTLTGTASIPSGVYSAGAGGGLVAYASNPPSTLLTIYAGSVNLTNLYLDCNSGASTSGIISAMGNSNRWTNVITRECSGDGGQVFNEGTPTTTLTAGTTAGSNTVLPVGATTTNRIVMGATYCTRLDVGYGTANEELVTISSISSLNVTVSSTAHNHSLGETVRCHGNSNDMHIERYSAYQNDGRGWHVLPGNDNNSIYWADGYSSGNALGGELWSGVKHIHIGGNYQGDGGPAVQLGTTDGTHVTHLMAIEPLSDIEETDAAYDAVVSYCDDSSQVRFIPSSALNIVTSAVSPLTAPCSAHSSGSSTMGYGSNSSNGELYIKNASGQVRIVPSGAIAAITITNAAGTTVGSVIQTSNVSGSGLMFRKDIADISHAQIEAVGATNANDKLMIGFDTTDLLGFIQSTVYGSTTNPLQLQPSGGYLQLHLNKNVSGLPACSSANDGDTYFVTDSNTTTFNAAVGASGANHVGVHCDGSDSTWKVGR